MGKYVRVVKHAGIDAAKRALKAQHQKERESFRDVERYLQDHRPDVWQKVMRCRTTARVARDRMAADRWIVRMYGCHVEPWCFACVREKKHQRARDALRRFERCKPAKKEPRFAHIVQTAQLTEAGDGWGAKVIRDVTRFRDTIMRVVKDSYGAGFGAYASYQAFGERAFGKLHPHLDFSLNGYSLAPQGAEMAKTYDLKAGGRELWTQRTKQHASARFLLHPSGIETNLNIQAYVVGAPSYYRALLYQVRELVDVRKMAYDRQRQLVYWQSYRDNRREKMTVQQFHEGLADYQAQVGAWGNYQARTLHVGVGHMADRSIEATQQAMGGEDPKHRKGCYCSECVDWEQVWPNDEGEYEFDPWQEKGASTPGEHTTASDGSS